MFYNSSMVTIKKIHIKDTQKKMRKEWKNVTITINKTQWQTAKVVKRDKRATRNTIQWTNGDSVSSLNKLNVKGLTFPFKTHSVAKQIKIMIQLYASTRDFL